MTRTAPSCPRRTPRLDRRALLPALALLALLLAPAAQALKSDRQQPLLVNSNSFKAEQNQHITTLLGNVTLQQGTLKGLALKGTVYTDANNKVTRVVLEGNPARLSQQLDGGGEMHSTASTIDYSPATDTAILIGDAHVDQPGRGSYSGARLVYNTSTGAMQGEGGGGGQVHLIFQPHDKIAAPKPAKPAKPTTLAPPTAQPAHASSGGQP